MPLCKFISFSIVLCTVAAILSGRAFSEDPQGNKSAFKLENLAWLTGSWSSGKQGILTEEHWIEPRGGIMLAVNRTSKTDHSSYEFLRIEQQDKTITYFASPGGQSPVPFELTELTSNTAVFENPQNSFPQKITYRRNKDKMHVKIEAVANGQTRKTEWIWEKND